MRVHERVPAERAAQGRPTVVSVALAVVLATAMRLPFIGDAAYPDEGGYLLVARAWHADASGLYGRLFVDRPPLLLLFWRLADALGGVEGARWMACLVVAALVVGAGWGGWLLGGKRAAQWSAFTAAALASTPALGGDEVDGELLAAPFVLVGCVLAVLAVRDPERLRWGFLAGLSGVVAALVKQNFVDALVFAFVLVAVSALGARLSWRDARRVLAAVTAGAAVPVLATLTWAATTHSGMGGLVYALFGFRSAAAAVISGSDTTAPMQRLASMGVFSVVSGVSVLTLATLWWQRRRLRLGEPVPVALAAMLLVGLTGVALGGSYWIHYLLGLVPVLALTIGSCSVAVARRGTVLVSAVVASAVVMTAVTITTTHIEAAEALAEPIISSREGGAAAANWLQEAAHSADTVVVAYGHADIIEGAGLNPGYRYLWSLPMRTLDPHLNLLIARLSARRAPTWVVEEDTFDSWDIDAEGRLSTAIRAHYRLVATVCGAPVYLRQHVRRQLPTVVPDC